MAGGSWAFGTGGWMLWALNRGADTWSPGIRGWILEAEKYDDIYPDSEDEEWCQGGWAVENGDWMPETWENDDLYPEPEDEQWCEGGWAMGTCGWMLETGKQRLKTEESGNRVWVLRIYSQDQPTLY